MSNPMGYNQYTKRGYGFKRVAPKASGKDTLRENRVEAGLNHAKIEALHKSALNAGGMYSLEKARLTGLGLKSQDRYEKLKPLKVRADAAHSAYATYAKKSISGALDKIIRADAPVKAAAARSRSAWKMAKYNAKQGK